jgi:hypothetical protein
VQKNDHRPVRRAFVNDIEYEFPPLELFHRPTVSPDSASLR